LPRRCCCCNLQRWRSNVVTSVAAIALWRCCRNVAVVATPRDDGVAVCCYGVAAVATPRNDGTTTCCCGIVAACNATLQRWLCYNVTMAVLQRDAAVLLWQCYNAMLRHCFNSAIA